jgi:outer membrane protein OmpA-like peptidoglycan-associated protein
VKNTASHPTTGDLNKVVIEDRGTSEVDAIAYEQESFGWKDGEQVANIDAMPQEERESVVAALKANGGKFVLYFDYDTADISPAAHQEIIKHIAFMQNNPKIRLRLEGLWHYIDICNLFAILPAKRLLLIRNCINLTCTSIFNDNLI